MRAMRSGVLRRVGLGVAALTVGGAVIVLGVRPREPDSKPGGLDHAPACEGDKSCAVGRARALADRTKDAAHGDAYPLARALAVAFERDDCAAAIELATALERVDVDRAAGAELADAVDRALLAEQGFCGNRRRKQTEAPTPGSSVRLERAMCEGGCPSYAVTVTSEGEVTFEGAVFTAKKGTVKARVSPARARELFDAFERLHFSSRPVHVGQGTAGQGATLELKRGTTTTTVTDDAACVADASLDEALCTLERLTDQVAGSDAWIKDGGR